VPFGCFEQLQLADAGVTMPNMESVPTTRTRNSKVRFIESPVSKLESLCPRRVPPPVKSNPSTKQNYPYTNNLAFFAAQQKGSHCLQTVFPVPAL
jgi:hypothetical protein